MNKQNMGGCGKQHPVSGKVVDGSAIGTPKETSRMIEGNDLRSGKGKDNYKNK
jgi:hypothetical protein